MVQKQYRVTPQAPIEVLFSFANQYQLEVKQDEAFVKSSHAEKRGFKAPVR